MAERSKKTGLFGRRVLDDVEKELIENRDANPVDTPGHSDLFARIENNDPTLTVADFSHSHLTLDDFNRLAHALAHHPDMSPLLELNLSGNSMNEECCNAIVCSLKDLKFVEVLNLAGASLNPTRVETICTNLFANTGIKILDLSNNFISDDGIDHVMNLLVKNLVIRELSLRNNRITQKGADKLISYVERNPVIEKIDLRENSGITIGSAVLKMSNCTFVFKDVPPLFTKIENNDDSVTVADLSHSHFSLYDFKELARALGHRPDASPLVAIDLSGNPMDEACCEAIAPSLGRLYFVQSLCLAEASLTSNCAKIITQHLKCNRGITHLDLSKNFIGDGGLLHIRDLLKSNERIKQLSIRSNYITTKGVKDLIETLKHGDVVIEKIDLRENSSIDKSFKSVEKHGQCKFVFRNPPCMCIRKLF